jgi:hypothetical protein
MGANALGAARRETTIQTECMHGTDASARNAARCGTETMTGAKIAPSASVAEQKLGACGVAMRVNNRWGSGPER